MALENIANEDLTLAHGTGSPISGGTFTVTSVPSQKVKALDKGVHKDPLQYTFTGGNASGFDSGSIATIVPQTINATATKVKAENQLVMREGDFGTMQAQGTVGGVPTPIAGPVEISDAGQDKVKGQ